MSEQLSRQFRKLVGKKVSKVLLRPQGGNASGGGPTYNPIIIFSDGSSISFLTQEEENGGEYGTYPIIHIEDKQ